MKLRQTSAEQESPLPPSDTYSALISEFIKSGADLAEVTLEAEDLVRFRASTYKPDGLATALRSAIYQHPEFKKKVKIIKRGDKVYLALPQVVMPAWGRTASKQDSTLVSTAGSDREDVENVLNAWSNETENSTYVSPLDREELAIRVMWVAKASRERELEECIQVVETGNNMDLGRAGKEIAKALANALRLRR